MPYEVTIPQVPGTERVMIPLDIATALIQSNAIEAFAAIRCAWTPVIGVPGSETGETMPNPLSAINAVAGYIRNFVLEDFIAIGSPKVMEEAGKNYRNQILGFYKPA